MATASQREESLLRAVWRSKLYVLLLSCFLFSMVRGRGLRNCTLQLDHQVAAADQGWTSFLRLMASL